MSNKAEKHILKYQAEQQVSNMRKVQVNESFGGITIPYPSNKKLIRHIVNKVVK